MNQCIFTIWWSGAPAPRWQPIYATRLYNTYKSFHSISIPGSDLFACTVFAFMEPLINMKCLRTKIVPTTLSDLFSITTLAILTEGNFLKLTGPNTGAATLDYLDRFYDLTKV